MSRLFTSQVFALGVALSALSHAPAASAADLSLPRQLQPAPAAPATATVVDYLVGARLQSDYNFRGVSQSNRDPSGQSYFELQLFDNFLYGGFTTYKVDLPTRPALELDLTGGIRPKFGPFSFDLGFIYYLYPNERQFVDVANGTILSPRNTDFIEFAGKAAYSLNEQLTFGIGVFHAPDLLGTGAPGTYLNGTVKYTLPEDTFGIPGNFAFSAEYAHYFLGRTGSLLGNIQLPEYNYGNVGISYTLGNATVDVRYHNTDLTKQECFTFTGDPRGFATGSGRSNWCGDAVIATLSFDFVGSKLAGVFAPTPVAAPAPSERGGPPRSRDATGQAIR